MEEKEGMTTEWKRWSSKRKGGETGRGDREGGGWKRILTCYGHLPSLEDLLSHSLPYTLSIHLPLDQPWITIIDM